MPQRAEHTPSFLRKGATRAAPFITFIDLLTPKRPVRR